MFFYSTQLLEYSLIVMSVISIGHISTTALAATSLGSMTASVSGYSIILGMTTALDTILPSAWTSNQPQLVGLWAQRMSQSIKSLGLCHVNSDSVIATAVVVFISLAVSPLLKNLSSTDSVTAYTPDMVQRRINSYLPQSRARNCPPSSHLFTLGFTRSSRYFFDIFFSVFLRCS